MNLTEIQVLPKDRVRALLCLEPAALGELLATVLPASMKLSFCYATFSHHIAGDKDGASRAPVRQDTLRTEPGGGAVPARRTSCGLGLPRCAGGEWGVPGEGTVGLMHLARLVIQRIKHYFTEYREPVMHFRAVIGLMTHWQHKIWFC